MTTTDGSAKFKIKDIRTHHACGEIVALVTTPPDYEHLLLCDGQTIRADDYPELVEALGSNVLPNLNGRVLQGGSTAGEYKEAGLPNVEATVNNMSLFDEKYVDGAFYVKEKYSPVIPAGGTVNAYDVANMGFKASFFNPIYGASSTVQPPAYTVRYYICYG